MLKVFGKSLKFELALCTIVVILISICSISVILAIKYTRYARRLLREDSQALLKTVSYSIDAAVDADDKAMAEKALAFLRNKKEFLSAEVKMLDGSTYLKKIFRKDPAKFMGQSSILSFEVPVVDKTMNPIGVLRAHVTTKYLIQELKSSIIQIVYLALIVLSLSSCLIFFLLQKSLKPLSRLKTHIDEIATKGLGGNIKVDSQDEIGALAMSFNKMTDDLKRSMASLEGSQRKLKKSNIQLREASTQLVQAEKLKSIGQLASGIAHEVRNPLAIILHGVWDLEQTLEAGDHNTRQTLSMVRNSVIRADNIITSLLDFSRATKLKRRPEDINSILESSLNLVRAELKNIDVLKRTEKNLPKILVDKSKLEQVFINLYLNSIQAMNESGKLTIWSYEKRLKEGVSGVGEREEDYFNAGERAVIVSIGDNGTGIPEENLKKIFDLFFTTKSHDAGTGLGLAVSRNIIDMHKGLIEIESKPGKGTIITITLKIAKEEQNGQKENINY